MHRLPAMLLPLCVAVLAGCSGFGSTKPGRLSYEAFDTEGTYSRSYDQPPEQVCEAARRALLGQGYAVTRAEAGTVEARKYFQPDSDVHEQLEFRVVCMPQLGGERRTVAFATALQERYVLRRTNSSASVGVSALGSLSLPIGSSEDSLVKAGSETVRDEAFYRRFFGLLSDYLPPPSQPPADAEPAATGGEPG